MLLALAMLNLTAWAQTPASETQPAQPQPPAATQSQPAAPAAPAPAPAPAASPAPAEPAPAPGTPAAPGTPGAAPEALPAVQPPAPPAFRAAGSEAEKSYLLGSVDPKSDHLLEVETTGWGAAVYRIRLSRYSDKAIKGAPYVVQQQVSGTLSTGQQQVKYPLSAGFVKINNETAVDLEAVRWQTGATAGEYFVTLENAAGKPVLRIQRRYRLDPASYVLKLDQSFENLSDASLTVTWHQYGQGDLPPDASTYVGDKRHIIAGYYHPSRDPQRQFVWTDDTTLDRPTVLGKMPVSESSPQAMSLWPYAKAPEKSELLWFALTNRYFAGALFTAGAVASPAQPGAAPVLDARFATVGLEAVGAQIDPKHDRRGTLVTLETRPMTLAAGQKQALDLALYIGPLKHEILEAAPFDKLGLDHLIIYNLGGCCAVCTFQWLARLLLSFLKLLHNYVTFDWGMAIIVLVAVVRLILHPITKSSQINMTRMQKQMAELQPELEKIKKKYKGDQDRISRETTRLFSERGVNPMGMLGCAPMFLQMPIWIALYAMLFFAIELRHQPAFWGLFQSFGGWQFLADLSRPDHFITFFDEPRYLNLIITQIDYSAINLLPILMAVVFYYQQKLTTPPATTEQAKQQQEMMKYTVLLFPVLMYQVPSGLTLYIFASTLAGILDSMIVKRHIKKEEEAGTLLKPAKPSKFMARINAAMEQALKERERRKP